MGNKTNDAIYGLYKETSCKCNNTKRELLGIYDDKDFAMTNVVSLLSLAAKMNIEDSYYLEKIELNQNVVKKAFN